MLNSCAKIITECFSTNKRDVPMADENKSNSDVPEVSQGDTNSSGENHTVEGLDSINTDEIIGDFHPSEQEFPEETQDFGELEDDQEEDNVAPDSDSFDDNPDDGDYPFWDEQYNTDFNDDSIYGDPDNVALTSEDDVFTNEDGIKPYSPGESLFFGDTVSSGDDDDDDSGFTPMFWVVIGIGTALALALASWGALWANTGEANPVKAIKEGSSGETSVTQEQKDPSAVQTIEEEDPAAASEENRIVELESSLTSALDDAQSARDEAEQLKVAADARPNETITMTKTTTKTGPKVTSTNTKTVTNTKTNTKTTTKTVRSTDTMKVTRTSTVRMAPTTTTKKVPTTVKVPGPERTVTKTVPSGRVTVTTTVVERWG